MHNDIAEQKDLKLKQIVSIDGLDIGSELMVITLDDGTTIRMYHPQECCEHVRIADTGDATAEDLVGGLLVEFYETSSPNGDEEEESESDSGWGMVQQWTYYNIRTTKGDCNLRWLGESNGYYSTGVTVRVSSPGVEEDSEEY